MIIDNLYSVYDMIYLAENHVLFSSYYYVLLLIYFSFFLISLFLLASLHKKKSRSCWLFFLLLVSFFPYDPIILVSFSNRSFNSDVASNVALFLLVLNTRSTWKWIGLLVIAPFLILLLMKVLNRLGLLIILK